jgi:hypothetical protein
MPLESI